METIRVLSPEELQAIMNGLTKAQRLLENIKALVNPMKSKLDETPSPETINAFDVTTLD